MFTILGLPETNWRLWVQRKYTIPWMGPGFPPANQRMFQCRCCILGCIELMLAHLWWQFLHRFMRPSACNNFWQHDKSVSTPTWFGDHIFRVLQVLQHNSFMFLLSFQRRNRVSAAQSFDTDQTKQIYNSKHSLCSQLRISVGACINETYTMR